MLPAAGGCDALLAPDSGGAVKIEKSTGMGARGLFDDKMAVHDDGLEARQERIFFVEMSPAGLNHADAVIGEEMNGVSEEIRFRDNTNYDK